MYIVPSSNALDSALDASLMSLHYDDVIMTMLASQITSLTVVYSIVYSGVNQRKHQRSASLAFVREIHRGPVNFPHKWPVTRKMFPFDDVIMLRLHWWLLAECIRVHLTMISTHVFIPRSLLYSVGNKTYYYYWYSSPGISFESTL